MTMRVRAIGAILAVFAEFTLFGIAHAQLGALDYQLRANRYEGVRRLPRSGFDIELLSARVDFRDVSERLSDRLHVGFYLSEPTEVHLVVRELDYKHYYWLDRAVPSTPWQAGVWNVFAWPTSDVIQQLKGLTPEDLGVVVRLGRGEPTADEMVAPAVLYQSQYPSEVKGYVFVFRARYSATIKAMIFTSRGEDAVFRRDLGRQIGGRPFTIKWELPGDQIAPGTYKLVLSGHLLRNNDPVKQTVRFHHERRAP